MKKFKVRLAYLIMRAYCKVIFSSLQGRTSSEICYSTECRVCPLSIGRLCVAPIYREIWEEYEKEDW